MSISPKAAVAPQPIILEGRYARLEPIREGHARDLYAASVGEGVPERYRWLFEYPPQSVADLELWIRSLDSRSDLLMYAVIDGATGRCAGRQAYMRIFPEHASIEIGSIYWGPSIARTRVATEAFYLFAAHAFDELGYRRFEWKCDNRNEASKAAALRFGFQYEGLFRQDRIVKGESRDTAWFSIIDAEWPTLKSRLQRWLAPENFDHNGQQKRPLRRFWA